MILMVKKSAFLYKTIVKKGANKIDWMCWQSV